MDEVEALSVDRRRVLIEAIESCLAGAPVELLAPVLAQLPQVAELGPVVPADILDLVGPARAAESLAQVVQHRVGNVDPKRLDGFAHGGSPRGSWVSFTFAGTAA
jgi:hypothetical protein